MIAIIQSFPLSPPKNGGTKSNFLFATELHKQTEMVCISTTNNDPSKSDFRIIPLFPDNKSKYLLPSIASKIIQECTRLGVDTILLNHPYMAPILFKKARKAGIQIILYAHNIEYQRFRNMKKPVWPILYFVEKWSMNYADYILFVSEEDKQEAIQHFKLPTNKLISAPVPLEHEESPTTRQAHREAIRKELGLDPATKLLYYYGPMDYIPNREGLKVLLTKVLPILDQAKVPYLLALSGKGLDAACEQLIQQHPNVKWLGFVDDFEAQLQASDIMINPIWLGGGVKVKLMEALGNGVTAISFHSGSLGIDPATAPDKLYVVPDQDAQSMAAKIMALTPTDFSRPTPASYYERYAGKNVVKRVLEKLNSGQ